MAQLVNLGLGNGDSYRPFKRPEYPDKGYFKILRGQNFCGIESAIAWAAASKTTGEDRMSFEPSTPFPPAGGYVQVPIRKSHGERRAPLALPVHLQRAVEHFTAHVPAKSSARRTTAALSTDPADYTLSTLHHQAVAGVNYHIVMTTNDKVTKKPYEVEAVIHRDLSGKHHVAHHAPLRDQAAAVELSATPSAQQASSTDGADHDEGYSKVALWLALVVGGVALVAVGALGFVLGSRSALQTESTEGVSLDEDSVAQEGQPPSVPGLTPTSGARKRQSSATVVEMPTMGTPDDATQPSAAEPTAVVKV
jgi:hypothetical protein